MSWMSQLYKTYENNVRNIDSAGPDIPLTPLAHINANAQIEITLDEQGNFGGAIVLSKGEGLTLIPVTESSASRSSGAAPHALCDTLSYIAGDFSEYISEDKQRKTFQNRYSKYIQALKAWTESEYSHVKVRAVYSYVCKKNVAADLILAGILKVTEEKLFAEEKINGQPYEKLLVRFRVKAAGDRETDAVWQDATLRKSYISYYMDSSGRAKDICYVLGENKAISQNHPKGIVAANYGAKLISANDTAGFSFRGRFEDAEEACAISYEATQKVHSALTWLAKKQGVMIGSQDKRTFICWNPNGKRVPDIFEDLGIADDTDDRDNTMPDLKRQLRKVLQGYESHFDNTDDIIIIALDAATTGRLSITYYNELKASDFLERIQRWGESCCWFYRSWGEDGKFRYKTMSPTFKKIVECAFGVQQGNFIEASDKVLKEHTQRLVHCMLDQQKMPFDLVKALSAKASNLKVYTAANRELLLSTACAVIAKYYIDQKQNEGGNRLMELEQNHDRSFLFGRLLAVLEKVEQATYDRENGRETNAMRYQTAYANHPMDTWKILEQNLNPYFQRLPFGLVKYYKDMIGEIVSELAECSDEALNKGLDNTYLLGYYLQRKELNTKKNEKEKEES